MKKLIIMESPAKAKHVVEYAKQLFPNINWFGGASVGHIRELLNSHEYNIGVDWNEIIPHFKICDDKKQVVKDLQEKAKQVDEIILASDPDREGEAIAWHLYEVLKDSKKPFKRMRLNAITKQEVNNQLNNLNDIDYNLVNSANTRAILDKTIGFVLSKEVQQNVGGASTGRVQGATLRLIANNQKDIDSFKKEFNYTVKIEDDKKNTFNLLNADNKEWKSLDQEEMKKICDQLVNKQANVVLFEEKKFSENPFQPFDTQSALVAIIKKLKGNAAQATKALQMLYESGYITYIRTDSRNIDETTKNSLKAHIEAKYGQSAIGLMKDAKVDENAQEGHPAITPTDFSLEVINDSKLNQYTKDVYEIIYQNTIGYGLKSAEGLNQTLIIKLNNYQFKTTNKKYNDLGLYEIVDFVKTPESKNIEPNSQVVEIINKEVVEIESKPKTLFSETSLIKEMKKNGLGRPATYSSAVSVNQQRGYTNIDKKDKINITLLGKNVNEYLANQWGDIIAIDYTIHLEEELDSIAKGNVDYKKVLKEFWNKLMLKVSEQTSKLEQCHKCNQNSVKSNLVSKKGTKYSKCINENCDFIEFEESSFNANAPTCSQCQSGKLLINKTKTGNQYEYCSNKTCDYINWDYGLKKCAKCKIGLIYKGTAKNGFGFEKCKNNDCDFIVFENKTKTKSKK
ncbi:type IA DNA topoisomerase [Williamsoniiplasma lucivorax]|uniref:DNA topoisomerase n=1 Tax=Williamsoniiplasma lucivorax TaxID=209274 RepID=A0A2S5RDK8_9MOLU|nr:type IA DNA topoisomerase [Williamsoniiplasma lucivorax]PPE05387.1 DNA topoisomerase I [Williamsoniiplasma lucivorax]